MSERNVEAALREAMRMLIDYEQGATKDAMVQGARQHIDRALAALRSRGSSDTRRRCRECGRDEDYAMEDGSWICEACGCVSSSDTRLTEALEAVLMDANVTYGIVNDDGSTSPMMVERAAIVRALGYEDESAWLSRTAEINALAAAPDTRLPEALEGVATTFQWLIERGQPEGQVPTVWLEHSAFHPARDKHWTTDANQAAMFPNRETAEIDIHEHFTHPVRGASARAVEHGFMRRFDVPVSPQSGSTDTRLALRERDGWMRHAQTSDREVRGLRLTLGTIYATWATRDCQHEPQAECVDDPDRDEAEMCDRCWLVDLIRKSIPEPGLTNTLALMKQWTEKTPRSCPECARENEHLMEDGSWICHSCGHVEFPAAEETT